MKSLLFTFSLIFLGAVSGSQRNFDGYTVLRTSVSDQAEFDFLANLRKNGNLDFWAGPQMGRFADIMATPNQLQELKEILTANRIAWTVHIENVQSLVSQEREAMEMASDRDMAWDGYYRLETIYEWINNLEAANPDHVKIINIGKSWEGRDLLVLKISNGGNQSKPAVWIDGTIHAREWIATTTVTYAINQLVNNASFYQDLLNSVDFYVLPVVNPDGYVYAYTEDRMWRATRSVRSGTTCRGCDPNRNFGFHWGESGSSPTPCSEIYSGIAEFSEPETVAVRDFILDSTNVNWQGFITVHSYSQLWMTPWGYTSGLPGNYKEMMRVGDLAVAALKKVNGTQYQTGSAANILYESSGTSRDWAKGVANITYVYTVELRDTGRYGFVLPPDQIIPTGEETFAGFLVVAQEIAKNHA